MRSATARNDRGGNASPRSPSSRDTAEIGTSKASTTMTSSRKFPDAAWLRLASSGSLDCPVACAPAALEMTEGEGIAEIDVIARHHRERNVKSVDHNEHERRQGDCDYTIQNDRHPERSVRRERFLQLASRPEGPCASLSQAKRKVPHPLLPPQRTKRALGAPVRQLKNTLAR
jgi:hypothetical protein